MPNNERNLEQNIPRGTSSDTKLWYVGSFMPRMSAYAGYCLISAVISHINAAITRGQSHTVGHSFLQTVCFYIFETLLLSQENFHFLIQNNKKCILTCSIFLILISTQLVRSQKYHSLEKDTKRIPNVNWQSNNAKLCFQTNKLNVDSYFIK